MIYRGPLDEIFYRVTRRVHSARSLPDKPLYRVMTITVSLGEHTSRAVQRVYVRTFLSSRRPSR